MITQFGALMLTMDSQIETLGLTLLHFLWQGALIAAAALAALWILRESAAERRYLVACLCLLAMALAPIATYTWLSQAAGPETLPVTLGAAATPAAEQLSVEPVLPSDWMPYLVAVWFAGATLLTLRLLAGWTMTLRWRRVSSVETPRNWLCHMERLRILLAVGRKVRLTFSSRVDSPAVVGWLRPVILMPLHMIGLAPEQAELLLAHELAHVRRHDALVNFLQRAIEAVLFYHPAVWWLSARIRAEREHCCDDIAIGLCGDPVLYARTLVALEESRASAPALALAANGGDLISRVRRILGMREETSDPWTPIAVTILTLGLLFLDSPSYQSAMAGKLAPEWDTSRPMRSWATSRLDTLLALDEVSWPPGFELERRRAQARMRPIASRISNALDTSTGDEEDFPPPPPPVAPEPAHFVMAYAVPAPPAPAAAYAQAAPPAPPAPPAPATASAQPAAAAPVAPPAPPAPPSPPGSHSWSWSWSRSGEGSIQMNNDVIRFVDDGRHYVIRDPAIIAQARSLFDPIRQLGREQREIGKKQREAAHFETSELRRSQHRAAAELHREIERLQSKIRSAVRQHETARIEALAKEMAAKAKEFEGRVKPQADEIKVKMDEIQVKMKAIGEEMKEKRQRMSFMSEQASRKLRELLKESVKNGKAQPESLQ